MSLLPLWGILLAVVCVSCKPDPAPGRVRFVFQTCWGDSLLRMDGHTEYVNAAGNVLRFDKVEYFIQDLSITGNHSVRFDPPMLRYVSSGPYSEFLMTHDVPVGHYSSVHFTFGIDAAHNLSNVFSNTPEKDMFWPLSLGGGYHYMKIDGKWKNSGESNDQGFGLHLGALRVYTYDTLIQEGEIVRIDTFSTTYHKSCPITLSKTFQVEEKNITTVIIRMDVKNWMEVPYRWDFNVHGGAIMMREPAMDSLIGNIGNVFR